MSIYTVRFDDFIINIDDFIGESVKVVKGRKYPVGTEFIIKDFNTDKWGNTYILTESGEKVAKDNCRLVVPREIKTKRVFHSCDVKVCPHCNKENTLRYRHDHFDPVSDYFYRRYVCDNCTADVDTI